jgi:hypothetical protein
MEKYADNATYVMRENAHIYITFLKGCDAGFPKKAKLSINLPLKNFLVES